jgi:NADPH:quinone reductase-like Zn-dependent oxidoreductase
MRIVQFHEFGTPEVLKLEDAPLPRPQAGEVLVRVHAAGVNPVDAKTRRGQGVAGRLGAFPLAVGWDLSGVVAEVGAGVTRFVAGDEVYGMPRFPARAATYAEYAVAPADELARKPAGISHLEAAGLPLAALTAWQAFEAAELRAGQRVLVHAAAGGVGHLAVQLAKARGAHVIGTASARNLEFVEALGADEVIDYGARAFENAVQDVDVALNTVGPDVLERTWQTVKPGGIVVSIVGMQSPQLGAARGVRGQAVLVQPSGAQLEAIAELVTSGALRVEIEHALPLEQAAEAHRRIETGRTRGKIVLQTA